MIKWRWLILGTGAVICLVLNWTLYPHSQRSLRLTGKETSIYLYCPTCGFEIKVVPSMASKRMPCPNCSGMKGGGGLLRPSAQSHNGATGTSASKMVAIAVVDFTVLLAGLLYFMTSRRKARAPVPEELYYFTCRQCKRRLRYRLSQIGQAARCPGCKSAFIFPVPAVPFPE